MNFDIVCFDCDSTLSKIEGVDELAKRVGMGEELAVLTTAAMNGEVSLESVYARRWELIRPDRGAIAWLGDLYIEQITPGALEVVQAIQKHGVPVHIISGGVRQAILPLAGYLGIPRNRVHAVEILFNAEGNYGGFDENSPLVKTGGKAQICRQINLTDAPMVMIGDGQTDLEAQQAGAIVIGFGGVEVRPTVAARADFYIKELSLMAVLEFLQ